MILSYGQPNILELPLCGHLIPIISWGNCQDGLSDVESLRWANIWERNPTCFGIKLERHIKQIQGYFKYILHSQFCSKWWTPESRCFCIISMLNKLLLQIQSYWFKCNFQRRKGKKIPLYDANC